MFKRKLLLVLGFVLALAASPSLWAQQFARPDATVNAAGWTAVNAATHHEALNEITANDADYIDSGGNNSSTVILGLSNVADPGLYANNHILRYRCQATGGKGGAEECSAALYEGATLIFDSVGLGSANRGAFALYEYTIPDASGITDYTNLSVQITSAVGNGESIQVSWFELEVPTPTVSAPTVTTPTFAAVTDSTATLGGNVTAEGGATVTNRGVEWGTAPGGPYPNSVPQGVGGAGIFTVPVTILPASTLIYFRAWASHTLTGYSAESSFTTTAPVSLATVDSPTFTSVVATTAILGGTVSADGDGIVTDRGVVWNTASPAETGGTTVSMGSGLGTFEQLVSSLPPGTLIYFKAYGVNSAGTAYSAESSFTTQITLATVDTPTVTSITITSAVLGGTVSSDGGSTVTDRGTVWDISPNPTGNSLSQGSGTGTFSHLRTGLPTATLVYFRAYATNAAGTAYSADASFIPSEPPIMASPTATSITYKSAVLGGTIVSDGGNPILERGTVWNTTGTPVIENVLAAGGTTIGVFSHTRTPLPAGTTIFYRAYATSAVGTGYSAESSFVTPTEPNIQVSNINFPRVAGKSMTISWTRGNGDGSIVVLRLLSTAKTDPLDGDDYVDDQDYTLAPEIPVGSQNFVVYKGTRNYVLFTGLSLNTDYSVAIYTYAGSGAATDYLQLNPAEASQTTTGIPVHNMDNNVGCSDCHNHGSWFARGAELKAVCETCHNPAGRASAKLEFDNHLLPSKNPAVDLVDCGSCHEMHNPIGADTIQSTHSITSLTQNNKSFLRANVNKHVPTAATPAYLHADTPKRETPHSDAPQDAITPDRAVEGGDDTTARGYCQVCHTFTKYHRSSSTAGSDQCHDGLLNDSCGPAETHCGDCHQHNNSFVGSGGLTTCVGCHDSLQGDIPRPIITTQFDLLTNLSSHIPGGSAVVTQEDCLVCHSQGGHKGQIVEVLDVDDGVTIFAQPTAVVPTTNTGEGEQFAEHCMSCHDDGVAASLAASGSDQTQTSPFTGSAAPPVIDPTAWSSAGHNRPSATFPASPVSCLGNGGNGCHGSAHGSDQNFLLAPAVGAAVSPIDFCYVCHDPDGPSSHDIMSQFNGATNFQTTSASTALVNQRHDITAADQAYSGGAVTCKDCHAPHVDSAANPVADPDTALPLATYSPANSYTDDGNNFSYDSGGNLDPTNPEGGGGPVTEPDYIQFCLTCHDGTAPPGVTIPASLLNIAVNWGVKQHGAGDGSSGSKIGKGNLKPPFTTAADYAAGNDPTAPYAAMNCTTCHGAHGTGNIFNLRESINVAGVQMEIGSEAGGQFPKPTFSGTTYTLPVNGGSQNDHEWGAWCTFCHNQSAHAGVDETTGCTGGHMHGGNSF